MESKYDFEDYTIDEEGDEYLTRCVVDPMKRTIYVTSNEGDERKLECEDIEQFMNVLELVRAVVPEDILVYINPLSRQKFLIELM